MRLLRTRCAINASAKLVSHHHYATLLDMTESATASSFSKTSKEPLPPGMVLGPDGKPCKICTAFRNWRPPKAGKDAQSSTSSNKTNDDARGNANANANFASVAGIMSTLATGTVAKTSPPPVEPDRPDEPPEGCPPDTEQLGRATWTFLHTTAAYYPENPTPAQRTRMLGLLFALPVLYPCWYCAKHLGENMQLNPPDVSSRVSLSRWLCERHNEVNKRKGKPLFDCSIKSTDERWKDGPSDGRCD